MNHRLRLQNHLRVATLVLLPALTTFAHQGAVTTAPPVQSWANDVWAAAQRGDIETVETRLGAAPFDQLPQESADRFRSSLERMRTNRAEAVKTRETQQSEALVKMQDEMANEHLAEALRQAVTLQSLSQHYDSAFENKEVMDIVRWASERVPELERNREWLEAQILLYRLKTFYEDTSRRDEFERYTEELARVNERVGLLARYAPRRLYEMRAEWVKQAGEKPLPPFNAATLPDWRERMDGVTADILKDSLSKAADEHIETGGWRPLLKGGLKSLELLATTTTVSETFASIADPQKVSAWVNAIHEQQGRLERLRNEDLNRWIFSRMLDDVVRANQRTLNLPTEVVLREFGDGALHELDPYSEIVWPADLRRFQQAMQGNFVGVGVIIRHNDKREIEIVNPLEGTPAYFAGIKPGDIIVEVNGESTVGWSLNDAVDRITGARGSKVVLGVTRKGADDTVQVPIVRDIIKIRSVKGWRKEGLTDDGDPIWDWYIDPVSGIVYIRLTQFTEDTFEDLKAAWRGVVAEGHPNGVILDLRHNPGGLLSAAVNISNLFLKRGVIVTGENKLGEEVWDHKARPDHAMLADIPLVILVNKGSASASEIVSGALQAHGRVIVVGERTYGKGSVQTVHHIARDGLLKLTTQYYRLPSPDGGKTAGRLVHRRPGAEVWGVDPDIVVPLSELQAAEAIDLRQNAEILPGDDIPGMDDADNDAKPRPDVSELLTRGIDPQLETALLILQAQALASTTEGVRHASR